jgi:disulfide bond formation protein DsbB
MVFTFLGVMPLALLILRVINSPRFHAIFQVFAAVLAILGAGIGIYIGLMYNRVRLISKMTISLRSPKMMKFKTDEIFMTRPRTFNLATKYSASSSCSH